MVIARRRLRELVHETALNDLSDVDRAFLRAMAVDDGSSRVADIAKRLDKGSQYVNTYRGRLAAAGIIEAPARGRVDFAIPYLRETLERSQLTVVSSWVARVSTTYSVARPVADSASISSGPDHDDAVELQALGVEPGQHHDPVLAGRGDRGVDRRPRARCVVGELGPGRQPGVDLGATRDRDDDADGAADLAGDLEHGLAGRGLEVGDAR